MQRAPEKVSGGSVTVLRLLSSLPVLLLAAIAIPLAAFGQAMAAFGPNFGTSHYDPHSLRIFVVIALVALVPTVAIWIPHKAALIVGGIVLLLPVVLGAALIWAIPQAAIFVIPPLAMWYFTAVAIWKRL